MEESAFLRAIAEAPDDRTTRLVYADWLEERGDAARADYLRLDEEWVRLPLPANLECEWGRELPSVEERYPAILRLLSEQARSIDLGWQVSVRRIGVETRRLVEQFVAGVPGSLAGTPLAATENWRKAIEDVRQMFEKHVGERVTCGRFCVPVDYALFTAVTESGIQCPEEWGMSYFPLRRETYRRVDGIAAALCRVSARLKARIGRDFALEQAVGELTTHEVALAEDFTEFFPALQARVEQWMATENRDTSR